MNQITSDEDSSNQLLRLYHTSSSGLRRTTAVIKKSARIWSNLVFVFLRGVFRQLISSSSTQTFFCEGVGSSVTMKAKS